MNVLADKPWIIEPGGLSTLEAALKHGVTHRDVRVKLGVYLAETGHAGRAIQLLDGLAGDDIEALNALGIDYGQRCVHVNLHSKATIRANASDENPRHAAIDQSVPSAAFSGGTFG